MPPWRALRFAAKCTATMHERVGEKLTQPEVRDG